VPPAAAAKTTQANDDVQWLMIGRPVTALKAWLSQAKIEAGPVFRRIDQWGSIDRRPLTPQSITPPKGQPGAGQVPGAWVAVRLSDRGSHTAGAAAGGDAAMQCKSINQAALHQHFCILFLQIWSKAP